MVVTFDRAGGAVGAAVQGGGGVGAEKARNVSSLLE